MMQTLQPYLKQRARKETRGSHEHCSEPLRHCWIIGVPSKVYHSPYLCTCKMCIQIYYIGIQYTLLPMQIYRDSYRYRKIDRWVER